VAVDVPVECNDLGAQLSQDSRRRGRGHPVPAVDRDPEAVEIVPEPLRVRADRVVEVAVEGVDALRLGPLVPRRRGLLARDAFLDGALGLPVELAAVSEQLDPVVGRRVVRGREHHAVPSLRGVRERRGREPPGAEHPDAPGREARLHRGRDRRTRHASVTREDDLVGSRPLQPLVLQPRRRGRRPTRELRCHSRFGATADPRGSEQVHISGVGRRSLEVVGCGSPSASLSYDGPRGFNSAADAATTDDRPNASTRVRLSDACRASTIARRPATPPPGRGIDGWVRNLDDGRVEAVFEGPEDAVREMVAWCEMGSSAADVDGVDATYEEPEGLDGFEVRW